MILSIHLNYKYYFFVQYHTLTQKNIALTSELLSTPSFSNETGKRVSLNFSTLFSTSLKLSTSASSSEVSQKFDNSIFSISAILLSYSSFKISSTDAVAFSNSW